MTAGPVGKKPADGDDPGAPVVEVVGEGESFGGGCVADVVEGVDEVVQGDCQRNGVTGPDTPSLLGGKGQW